MAGKTTIVAIRPGQEQGTQFLRPGVDPEVVARAREALAAFHRLRPQLAAFARVMTGDNTIGVLPTGGAPATDGKNIYIKPNLGLGDNRRHPDPRICHTERQPDGLLICEACREQEEILVSLFHEIGHIVYDSFEAMDDHEKERAVERAIEEAERAGISERKIERVRKSLEEQPPKNYVEAAARISPFMPMLLNALEDARVNDLTIKARPGMKIMFKASDARIFREGMEQVPGKVTRWTDAPANAQVIIGTFIVASGIEIEDGWLSDEVTDALADPDLQELLAQVRESDSVKEVYRLAFPILERIRGLGFCKLDKDPDEEPEPQPQGESPEQSEVPDNEDTGGDDDDEGDGPTEEGDPAPSQSDPWGEQEQDEADTGMSDDEGSADTEAADEGEEGEQGEPGESDNENGQGGDWNSRERDDLGEGETELESDGDLGDDEVDEDEADASAQAPTGDDPADTDDEDGASGADTDDPSEDPADPDGDDTGDPHASGEDGDDEYEDDDDWGDDPHAQEGDGGDPQQGDDAEGDETYSEQGSPEDVQALLEDFGGHAGDNEPPTPEDKAEEEAIDRAIEQDKHFDQPSDIVAGIRIHDYDDPIINDKGQRDDVAFHDPVRGKVEVDERNIQSAVIPMRKAFAANKQGAMTRNLRSGRVNGRSLAKRVPVNDDRMFQKRRRPGKRDYHVVIGLDISGSTSMPSSRLQRIKSAAYMQAELCSRVGVPFEVWAHTGILLHDKPLAKELQNSTLYPYQISVEMYKVKDLHEPWTDKTRDRLWALRSYEVNLDGHTLEFYRKRLDETRASDKLLIYYTDGHMPNFNYEEELAILQRELGEFRKRNYKILGVGIDTDSPTDHGLDTVAVYDDADVRKVVMELEKRLA